MRLGLVCKFYKTPIKFKDTTYRYLKELNHKERLKKLSSICLHNSEALLKAINFCHLNNIGCFRITSRFFPLKTHPEVGYKIDDLPDIEKIKQTIFLCRKMASMYNIRLTFHPDQFVILNSPNKDIVRKSILELEYHNEIAELVGADVINIHAGGFYKDKKTSLKRLFEEISKLDKKIIRKLTIENDDRIYTPSDLINFCIEYKIPFLYDILHHRCNPDSLTIKQATELALKTWNREPVFHLSSKKITVGHNFKCHHADYVDIRDFPEEWKKLNITIEVEAKAKEVAIKKLQKELLSKKIKF